MKRVLCVALALVMLLTLVGCGSQDTATSLCENCGTSNPENAKFCQSCGKQMSPLNNETENTGGANNNTETDNSNTDSQHQHNYTSKVIAPTCVDKGYTEFSCECGHTYKDEFKDATGHVWGNPTCTTARSCLVCWTPDPSGKPLGHSFVQGVCEICGHGETSNPEPKVTADRNNLSLSYETETVYITLLNWDVIEYDIANSSIVDCEWGEWDGDTIPLTFIPLCSGKTTVRVYPEGYSGGVVINVSVNLSQGNNNQHSHSYSTKSIAPTCTEQGYTTYYCTCGHSYNDNYVSALGHTEVIDAAVPATPTSTGLTEGKHCSTCGTILVAQQVVPKDTSSLIDATTFELTNNLSQEYTYAASVLYTRCKIDSISHSVTASSGGKITLNITVLMKKTVQGETTNNNIKLHYTLYRDGVAVKSMDLIVTNADMDTLYEKTISYTGLPGNYTLTCKSVLY